MQKRNYFILNIHYYGFHFLFFLLFFNPIAEKGFEKSPYPGAGISLITLLSFDSSSNVRLFCRLLYETLIFFLDSLSLTQFTSANYELSVNECLADYKIDEKDFAF